MPDQNAQTNTTAPEHALSQSALLAEAYQCLKNARYTEMPMAEKIKAYLDNPEITKEDLEKVYKASLKRWCGIG